MRSEVVERSSRLHLALTSARILSDTLDGGCKPSGGFFPRWKLRSCHAGIPSKALPFSRIVD